MTVNEYKQLKDVLGKYDEASRRIGQLKNLKEAVGLEGRRVALCNTGVLMEVFDQKDSKAIKALIDAYLAEQILEQERKLDKITLEEASSGD